MLLLHLSIAICLGFADIVNTFTLANLGEKKSYQAVFWFEVACAGAALVILVLFVKIKKAESAMTADEILEMEAELRLEAQKNEFEQAPAAQGV